MSDDMSLDFEGAINELVDKEVERRVREEFVSIITGDWENDITSICAQLEKKINDKQVFEELILSMFYELFKNGRISGVVTQCQEGVYNDDAEDRNSVIIDVNGHSIVKDEIDFRTETNKHGVYWWVTLTLADRNE